MYKKYSIICCLVVIIFLSSAVIAISNNPEKLSNESSENKKILYVGGNGPGNYSYIQNAIDDANPDDTIFVFNGTYSTLEFSFYGIYIDKSITIIGEDKNKTIIDGGGDFVEIVHISNTNFVNISGFTIQNGICGIGIYDSSNNLIKGNIITAWQYGIGLTDTYNNTIIRNKITNLSLGGLAISGSSNNIIKENTFTNCSHRSIRLYESSDNNIITDNIISTTDYGINLEDSSDYNTISGNIFFENELNSISISNTSNNIIRDNVFHFSGIDIHGSTVNEWNTHTIENNTANGRPIRYYSNMENIKVPSDTAQLILANCRNFSVKNLNISHVTTGIRLGFSSYNTITENNVNDNIICGIHLSYSTDNIIWNNNFINNSFFNGIDEKSAGNNWDNGSVGNFWSSNWYKTDEDYDGIGDKPYYIPVNGIDNFPLMVPFEMTPDNNPPEINIEIPKEGYLHFGNLIDPYPSPSGQTGMFAGPWMNPIEIKVRATDNSGSPTIIIFIDDYEIDELWRGDFIKLEPLGFGSDLYKGKLEKPLIGKHTLTFICYDKYAQKTCYEIESMFFYFPHPAILP
jgi:parallel beta-helix repeat protein